MAFDACMMRAVLEEFRREFPEGKIEKVLQPKNDEINLIVHYGKSSRRLVFNVGPNAPRLQLSDLPRENPLQAPMFCMLLRKHLTGGRIVGVEQLNFDRIAVFRVNCYDDMGYRVEKKIVCEIMGKYANLILLDSEDKILAALKVIDFAASTVRQVLPGLKYQIPEQKARLDPIFSDRAELERAYAEFPKERAAEKFIISTYSGIATQIARELVHRASGKLDTPLGEIGFEKLYGVVSHWQQLLREHRYQPTVIFDSDGKPTDYSYMDVTYYGDGVKKAHFSSLAELFDLYFAQKDRIERVSQRAKDVIRLVNSAIARTRRKLAIQREALAQSERAEEYRRRGDLITANLFMLKRGLSSFECVDYYDDACPTVTVELDPLLTPAQNAQRAYKLYNKAKTAREVLTEQISIWEGELFYLEGVEAFLDRAETEEDLTEIRDELYRAGYGSRLKGYRPMKAVKSRPLRFVSSGGYTLLVGRNNTQNDQLTFKLADKGDLWFHVKDLPGSHVILVCGGEEPPEADYTEACALAAYYSKATGDRVAVDYTRVKNIKKPQGSRPGFVTYKTNFTAYVKPMSGESLRRENG